MNRLLITLAFLVALTCAFLGCQNEETAGAAQPQTSMQGGAPATQKPDFNAVAATVGEFEITVGKVEEEFMNLMSQYRGRMAPDQLEGLIPMLRQRALAQLINMKLLADECAKFDITVEESLLDEKFNEIAGQFPDPEMFETQLINAGMTKEKLRSDIERSLKINKLLEEKVFVDLEVTDEDVAKYYSEHEDEFKREEEVQASHILIAVDQGDSEEVKKEKRDKLSGIRQQIVEGADFAELATANSECPSKDKGGDLGPFTRGRMVAPFSEAAFKLNKGELSDIVETQFGYHLIKTTEKFEGGIRPLEEVRDNLKDYLKREGEQTAFNAYVKKLSDGAKVEYGEGFGPMPEEPGS